MSNFRINFIDSVHEELLGCMSREDAARIVEMITIKLEPYDLSERCTDICVLDNSDHDLITKYVGTCYVCGKSESTIKQYLKVLKIFRNGISKPMINVDSYDIRLFMALKKKSGISERTLEGYRSVISAFYSWMYKEEFISKNPMDKVERVKCKKEIRKPFSSVEKELLRNSCSGTKEKAIVEFLLATGVRAAELCNLDISDIDFKDKSVHVRNGKGGKDRITYMTDVSAMHLANYIKSRDDNLPVLFKSNNTANGSRYGTDGIRVMIHKISKRAEVEDVHPHRFRRTFATDLSNRGMDVRAIQQLMGHSSIETTMRYIYNNKNQIQSDYKKFA